MADGILSVGADVSPMVRDVRNAYGRLQKEISGRGVAINTAPASRSLRALTGDSDRLSRSLSRSAEIMLSFGAVSFGIFAVRRAFGALVKGVRETELAFAKIQSILQVTQDNFESLQRGVFEAANKTGIAFSEAAQVANEFARQGLSLNETLTRTKDSLILVRLAGLSTGEAVASLTAIINTFRQEALGSSEAVEKLATVAAAFAVSEADLATAIQRSGATAADAGTNFNELISIISALQERTARGGAVIGNGLKSIFTRIQRKDTLDLLEGLNIQVRDLEGNTIPALDVLTNLSKQFKNLSDEQQSLVVQSTAGLFQVNNLRAIIADLGSEFSIYRSALDKANGATDQATVRNEKLNETLDALFQRTSNNTLQFAANLGTVTVEPLVRDVLNGLNTIFEKFDDFRESDIGSSILDGISNVLTGPVPVLILGFVAKVGIAISKGLINASKDFAALGGLATQYSVTQSQVQAVLETQNQTHRRIIDSARGQEAQAQAVLRVMRMITAEAQASAAATATLTANVNRVGAGRAVIPTRQAAGGFIPQVKSAISIEESLIKSGVGGANLNAKPVVLRNFNTGNGRETIVANTDEYLVKNFNGTGASAILNKDMVRSLGGRGQLNKLGEASKITAAGGSLPNPNLRLAGDKGLLRFNEENVKAARNLKEYNDNLNATAKSLRGQKAAIERNQKELTTVTERLSKGPLGPKTEAKLLQKRGELESTLDGSGQKLKKIETRLEKVGQERAIIRPELRRRQTETKAIEAQALQNRKITADNNRILRQQQRGRSLDRGSFDEQVAAKKTEARSARVIRQQDRASGIRPFIVAEKKQVEKERLTQQARDRIRGPKIEKTPPVRDLAFFQRIEREKLEEERLKKQARESVRGPKPVKPPLVKDQAYFDNLEEQKFNEEQMRRSARDRVRGPKPVKVPVVKDLAYFENLEREQLQQKFLKQEARQNVDARNRMVESMGRRQAVGLAAGRPTAGSPEWLQRIEERRAEKNSPERIQRITERGAEKNRLAALERTREDNLEKRNQRRIKGGQAMQRFGSAALIGSIALPMIAEGFRPSEDDPKAEEKNARLDGRVKSLSAGLAIFGLFPNKIGLIAAGLTTVGLAADSFFKNTTRIGQSSQRLRKESEEASNAVNENSNSIRAFFGAQGQLSDAIARGADVTSIISLEKQVSDALFEIQEPSIRNEVLDISSLPQEDRFEASQKLIREQLDPDVARAGQTEFLAKIRDLDDSLSNLGSNIERAFKGSNDILSSIAFDNNQRGLVQDLIKSLGAGGSSKFESQAGSFLSDGGNPFDFLTEIGLEDAANGLKEFADKSGAAADGIAKALALEVKLRAIEARRIKAEENLTAAKVVARREVEAFVGAVQTATRLNVEQRSRDFALGKDKVSGRFSFGGSDVASQFTEFGIGRAEAISKAISDSLENRLAATEAISEEFLKGQKSQQDIAEFLGLMVPSLDAVGSGDPSISGLLDFAQKSSHNLEDLQNAIATGTEQERESAEKQIAAVQESVLATKDLNTNSLRTGRDLELSLTQLQNKLASELERIRKTGLANLFGGTAAVDSENPFEKGNEAFRDALEAIRSNNERRPRDRSQRQTFDEDRFAANMQGTRSRMQSFNESFNNGIRQIQSERAMERILTEFQNLSADEKTDRLDEFKERVKTEVSPDFDRRVTDQNAIIRENVRGAIGARLELFLDSLDNSVRQGRVETESDKIRDSLAKGESPDFRALIQILSRSRDPAVQGSFSQFGASIIELGEVLSSSQEAAIAAIEQKLDIPGGIKGLEAMELGSQEDDALDLIQKNTAAAKGHLETIANSLPSLLERFTDAVRVQGEALIARDSARTQAGEERAELVGVVDNIIQSIEEDIERSIQSKVSKEPARGVGGGRGAGGVDPALQSQIDKGALERISKEERANRSELVESLNRLRQSIENTGTNIPAPTESRAGGFIPQVKTAIDLEKEMIRKGVGGASPSAKPVVINGFNTGKGKETIVANTDEYYVKNFGGGSAIINRDMMNGVRNAATGFAPSPVSQTFTSPTVVQISGGDPLKIDVTVNESSQNAEVIRDIFQQSFESVKPAFMSEVKEQLQRAFDSMARNSGMKPTLV